MGHCQYCGGNEHDVRAHPDDSTRWRSLCWICRVSVVSVYWSSGYVNVCYYHVVTDDYCHRTGHKIDRCSCYL